MEIQVRIILFNPYIQLLNFVIKCYCLDLIGKQLASNIYPTITQRLTVDNAGDWGQRWRIFSRICAYTAAFIILEEFSGNRSTTAAALRKLVLRWNHSLLHSLRGVQNNNFRFVNFIACRFCFVVLLCWRWWYCL